MVLDKLQGGAHLLFGRLTAGELMAGVEYNGRVLPPLEYISIKLIEHFKEDESVMRRRVGHVFLNFTVLPNQSYEEFILRYEDSPCFQAIEGLHEWKWEENARRVCSCPTSQHTIELQS